MPSRESIKIGVPYLLSRQFIGGNFLRYDIIIRYLFVRKYIKSKDKKGFKYPLYSKFMKERKSHNRISLFIPLIESIKKYGYKKKHPIMVVKDDLIRYGSHRFSVCLGLNMGNMYINIDRETVKKQYYDKKWMIEHNLGQYFDMLEKKRKRIFSKLKIVPNPHKNE